jgi:hypothetical protein
VQVDDNHSKRNAPAAISYYTVQNKDERKRERERKREIEKTPRDAKLPDFPPFFLFRLPDFKHPYHPKSTPMHAKKQNKKSRENDLVVVDWWFQKHRPTRGNKGVRYLRCL